MVAPVDNHPLLVILGNSGLGCGSVVECLPSTHEVWSGSSLLKTNKNIIRKGAEMPRDAQWLRCSRSGFDSQHTNVCNSGPGDLMPSAGTRHVHDARTRKEEKHPYTCLGMCVCLLEFMCATCVQVFMESRVCQNPQNWS